MRPFKTPLALGEIQQHLRSVLERMWNDSETTPTFFGTVPNFSNAGETFRWEIKRIMGFGLALEPAVFIAGETPEDGDAKNQAYLLGALLLIAKKDDYSVMEKLKPPTVQQWRERLKSVYLMESITVKLQLRMEVFNIKWTPVILHLFGRIEDTILHDFSVLMEGV